MNLTYIALLAGILLVVFLLVRWVVKAQRRWGWGAAWLVILLEACLVGAAMYLAVQHVPGMGDTWIGQQLILDLVELLPRQRLRQPGRRDVDRIGLVLRYGQRLGSRLGDVRRATPGEDQGERAAG